MQTSIIRPVAALALGALAALSVACGSQTGEADPNQRQGPAVTKPGAGQPGATNGAKPAENANTGAQTNTAGDTALKAAVEKKLADAGVSGVTVRVENGRVFLTGQVPKAQYTKAVQSAHEASPPNGVDPSGIKQV